jgi:osmotically-inducible protein OsmY
MSNHREEFIERGYERPRYVSHRGKGPTNYRRSDERIREDVCEYLTHDERVDASNIEVNVQEGVVILSGSVDERMAKRRAEDIADSCMGVRDVRNEIRVGWE